MSKVYDIYEEFSENFACLIERLRYVPSGNDVEAADLINQLAALQTMNQEYADRFLLGIGEVEMTTLMEVGFGNDTVPFFEDYFNQDDNYFEDHGY